MSKHHRDDRRRYWSEAWARQIDARTFSGVIFRVHPAASLVGEACFSKFKKNGRYARPTSDRNFAGAIDEKDSFLLS